MANRPELEADHADQQRTKGDERGKPAFRLCHNQRDHHDGVRDKQEAGEDRPYRRPAGQVRSARRFIAASSRRVTSTCPRLRITKVL
jgi:hypothetical protein